MKDKLNSFLFFVLVIVTPQAVIAEDLDKSASGFSGKFQGGAFFFQTDSQLLATDSDEISFDLEGPADTYDEISPIASIYLNYQFEGGTTVYAGNPLQVGEELNLAAGVKQPFGDSTLDVALTWLPGKEVWKNPYQTAQSRLKSDADAYGLRFRVLDIGGRPWEASYSIDQIAVENDEIGDLENDLKRDGWVHELGVKYTLQLQKGVVFALN